MSFAAPHRRLNQLNGEWVLVSPQRMLRPWQGQVERAAPIAGQPYDPGCYLCPGNQRADGERNAAYSSTYVFTNDFPALLPDVAAPQISDELLLAEIAPGTCRVICFSPVHNLTLPEMTLAEINTVIDLWCSQTAELGSRYRWVQVFENKGEMMGASNPHPHGQIWALDALPSEVQKESARQRAHFEKSGKLLLLDYADLEVQRAERVVVQNEHWLVVVPFWAVWPFETLLLPRDPVRRLPDLHAGQRASLAEVLKRLLTRYDNLFETPFPYSMGWHGAPFDAHDQSHWQLHAHFYPPLLRSATVRKFMVGFELLGEAQRDLTPEQAAERLRAVSEVHYSMVGK
ncbi:MAG TPA: UDP-glucose--hexose-1-phosphate uridylyltransferase [Longimicrobiales bacterium]